ncbi:MAG: PilN domain-containing protein, partial [Candidatus Omnitrophica bacterium]|nr:PilN domain-containing protein [Candidatus Omnitrophota bacterium]
EGNVKRLRIIFIAIRNDTLEMYKNILHNAELSIKSIEPAQISLIRTLTTNNAMGEEEVAAIVEQEDNSGKITIVHNKVPLFVREFQTRNPSAANMNPTQAEANKQNQFVNEIRISLDYFARQDSALATTKVILISNHLIDSLVAQIKADLNVEVFAYSCKQLIGNKDAGNINYLSAYGAAVFGAVDLGVDINFSTEASKRPRTRKRAQTKIALNFKVIMPAALAALTMIGAVLFYIHSNLSKVRTEVNQIKLELGDYVDKDTETIELMNAKVTRKQKNFEKVRIQSAIAQFMREIPDLLPEGAWLDEFRVSYKENGLLDEPVISLNGYVFHEVETEQFRIVYRLQKNLQDNTLFAENFDKINILTTESQKLEGNDVTYFKVRCE